MLSTTYLPRNHDCVVVFRRFLVKPYVFPVTCPSFVLIYVLLFIQYKLGLFIDSGFV